MFPGKYSLFAVGIVSFSLITGSMIGTDDASDVSPGESSIEGERDTSALLSEADSIRLFDAEIAPMLARHCLECHDSVTKEGRLDLSRKELALADDIIIPGNAADSLLWDYVVHDEMPPPEDRPPLSDTEKAVLKQWIDSGAIWSADVIDPLALTRDRRAVELWLQRLTVPEYIETVRSALGVDIERDALRILPPDLRADGFSNTAYNLNIDLRNVEAYSELAQIIVGRMDVMAFVREHTGIENPTDEDLQEVIEGIGKWLFRGPLEGYEVGVFRRVAAAVEELDGDFPEAVSYIIEAMLQSPRFVYRVETQVGDGNLQRAGDYELASRLSYIMWGGPPDRELMRAADAGELSDPSGVEAQVNRMLEDPRTIDRSLQFIHEWLNLDQLDNLRPNQERFPTWSSEIAADMREETLAFFRDVVWEQERPLADLMNAQVTYATPRLAEHYGLDPDYAAAIPRDRALPSVPDRVLDGLQLLYTFEEGIGETVRDVSGTGDPFNLTIGASTPITGVTHGTWSDEGLIIDSSTIISSGRPAVGVTETLRTSGAFTLEAWVTPANTSQDGPARIITLSSDTTNRNFTLGQNGDHFEARVRTTGTSNNGLPGLSSASGTAVTEPTHVIYTHDVEGRARIFVNGSESGSHEPGGDLSNWADSFELALVNELSNDRPWEGILHLVAVYDRPLSLEEIRRNHAAGARKEGPAHLAGRIDLQALYMFDEGEGNKVRDVSNPDDPVDLEISDESAVEWTRDGLNVHAATLISSDGAPSRITEAIRSSGEVTVEAWVTPANTSQDGPARIVSLSSGTTERNFTLGQDGDRIDARFRTTETNENGMPGLSSANSSVTLRPMHVVYTRNAAGRAVLSINGVEQAAENIAGDLSNWDADFRLALGNEFSNDRPWQGVFHLVAIYNRALTQGEIRSKGEGLTRYDLASVPARGGLLTQGSVLTVGGDNASTVTRGLFVLHDILHSAVGSAPPGVDTTPVPPEPGLSVREIAEERLSNPSCTACHSRFEPLSFGLVKFDGVGAYSEIDEHGNELREDGEILFPGNDEPMSYETSAELMDLLAGSERVHMNKTRKVTQFALGRPLVESDTRFLERIHESAQDGGGTYSSLLKAIVMSDLVQMTRTEKPRTETTQTGATR